MTITERSIVVGALVQWTGARAYGVITNRDDTMLYVRWDNAGPPSQFAIDDPPLVRVSLDGQRVRLVSSGEDAAVLESTASDKPAWKCFVASDGGKTVSVAEAGLRPAEAVASELVEDPDDDLELRQEFSAELQASLAAVASGGATSTAEQVAQRQGLTW